ncbi:MAG: Hsp20/alpha crystallin family protein [bacterium]|nr:Hsp20/alpha crystallin family protein [bacterium]
MSFFEKLKNSMGVEEELEEKIEEKKPKQGKKEDKDLPLQAGKKVEVKSSKKADAAPTKEEAPDWFEPEGELAVDVYQTDTEMVIQSTIAGVKTEDLDISIENDTVTISGERKNIVEDSKKNYFYQECFWGAFAREIILPEEVDGGRAEATMKDGVFTLRIPKIERQKIRKVKVRG